MSFLFGSSDNKANDRIQQFGIQEENTVSNERGRPVPLIYGQQRIALTPLSQPFNQRVSPVREKIEKEKVTVGYNYYCSIALLACHGVVNELNKIYFDDEEVWPLDGGNGVTKQAGSDYRDITIAGYGAWRIYWGTDAQDFDPTLDLLSDDVARNPNGVTAPNVPEEHPAYRGQCYLVSASHFLGYNRTSLQNIEVVVSRYPDVSYLGQNEVNDDCDIAALLVDAFTNQRYGLALDDVSSFTTRLDRSALISMSDELALEQLGVSPIITRSESFRAFATKVLENVDGYIHQTTEGKVGFGLIRTPEFNEPDVPVIDENDLTEPLNIDVGAWEDTINEVFVEYTNRDEDWKKDATPGLDTGNRIITELPNSTTASRPWVTRPFMAAQLAQMIADVQGQLTIRGKIRIRRSRRQGLVAGGVFWLNYPTYGLCNAPCRVITVSIPDPFGPEVEIEFERHRVATWGTSTGYTPRQKIQYTPQAIQYGQVIELPFDSRFPEQPLVAFLAARPSEITMRFNVYREKAPSSYELIGSVESWARRGLMFENVTAAQNTAFDIKLTEIDNTLPDISSAQASNNEWVVLVNDEIISIHSPSLIDTGRYTVTPLRERFDTKRASHAFGDQLWVISLDELYGALWDAKDVDHDDTDTQTFKFQPVVLGNVLDLAQVTDTHTVTFTDRSKRHWKPRDLGANGVGRAAGTYSSGDDIAIAWTRVNREDGSENFSTPWAAWNLWYIEVRELDNTLRGTITKPAGHNSHTISNADLIGFLGSEMHFKVRIYANQNGYDSLEYDEVTVNLT